MVRCESPLGGLLRGCLYESAEDDGAIRRAQIFFGDGLNFLAFYGEEAIEDRVHELRLVVEQGEAGEEVHQAITRHAAAPAFERRIIIRTPFHFELIEFVFADSVLLDVTDYGIARGQSLLGGIFGLV